MRLLERRLLRKKCLPTGELASLRVDAFVNAQSKPIKTVAGAVECDHASSNEDDGRLIKSASMVACSVGKEDESPKTTKRPINTRLRRQLNVLNSLEAIKLKMFIFVVVSQAALLLPLTEAGFFTFYFPNIFKPKGYDELTEMIQSLDDQINSTKDQFADVQYFWGQLQRLEATTQIENNYPENSACSDILPTFRDLAIEYIYIDFEFYIKPFELYRQYLADFRGEWYPKKQESKTALPREWEQKLLQTELQMKIDHLERLTNEQEYRDRRQKMVDIWRNVRRSLDDSLQCIYLRYAYRQIAEDINQIALEANLASMRKAMSILVKAYERIAKWKSSDEKIIKEIEEELQENERFTIRE